MMLPAYWPEY